MTDFMGMMKQAAQLQAKMQELQAELDRIDVEGTAGGGLVTVKTNAKGELKGVRIDDRCSSRTRRKSWRTFWSLPVATLAARPKRCSRTR